MNALRAFPADTVLAAAFKAAAKGGPGGAMQLAPVVDGVVLPADPFTPAAPAISADVSVMIGSNKDEMTLFNAAEPRFGKLNEAEARFFEIILDLLLPLQVDGGTALSAGAPHPGTAGANRTRTLHRNGAAGFGAGKTPQHGARPLMA